jgi:hypothetical protein
MSYAEESYEHEPEEDDLVTQDHARFYQNGRLAVEVPAEANERIMWAALDAHMKRAGFYPNVWFLSDHGNAHLMSRPKLARSKHRRGG